MNRRSWTLAFLVVALTGAIGFGLVVAQDSSGDPWYPQPEPAPGDLNDVGLRTQLLAHKQDLCQDLKSPQV